jgi:hypothetical protein
MTVLYQFFIFISTTRTIPCGMGLKTKAGLLSCDAFPSPLAGEGLAKQEGEGYAVCLAFAAFQFGGLQPPNWHLQQL